ncbi:flagellar biosynthesis protein FlhA [Vibrio crassostreae]|uniref:flagellar biosynthesis protein FlhA n=1 Tax=Vibrio crassostreae TaxID=246167 RepID=UPI001B30D63D|nr:flagellar biosynthesis protein FlhA [Vibrio crassostreae]
MKFRSGLSAPLLMMLILAMIVVPLPPQILDILFVINIVISLSVLMACVYARRPLDFSIFPTILLLATLMRLSLNIASTRVILLNGGNGSGGAGEVIESFGNFVIGGNFVVGLVVFVILTIINFVVITKGAERISEVGARFTLDSMPGKQMAVDADLGSGQITQEEAAERRKEIGLESQFHGNMDGASKFVKGDAIAGVLILLINIIGGLVVGVIQNDMSYSEALTTFTLLSIGDGLVAILPSIIMALSTAIIITRVSSDSQLSEMASEQLLSNELIPGVTGFIITSIGLVPGMPNALFLSIGVALMAFAYRIYTKREEAEIEERVVAQQIQEKEQVAKVNKPKELSLEDLSEPPLVSIKLGFLLADIAKGDNNQLQTALRGLQKKLSMETGILIKGIHISDSADLDSNEYQISIAGIEHGRGEVAAKLLLALPTEDDLPDLDGKPAKEPVYGLDGFWIMSEQQSEAEAVGYEVLTPASVICAHIQQCIIRNLPLMVDLDDIQKMVDKIQTVKPKLVEAALSGGGQLTTLLKLVRELLRERVSVTQLTTILETMAEMAEVTLTFSDLLMHVRKKLTPWIISSIAPDPKAIKVITFTEPLQEELNKAIRPDGSIFLDPRRHQEIEKDLRKAVDNLNGFDYPSMLMVNPVLRRGVFDLFGEQIEELHVLDFLGIPKGTSVDIAITIG